ncbi:hypothetical protein K388_06512 [Streptomyces sp. KhCrAH-43]|nr:hypothetical protein K388_06512 [Streptomyces sp. KhCrAH-43]
MDEAVRGLRFFVAVLSVGGVCLVVGGAVSGNALLMVLGAIAAVCGLGLGVLAYLAHRKA